MAQDTYVTANVRTSGASFSDLQSDGLRGLVAALVAANAAITDPTSAATVSATGGGASGGALPAGDYFVSYTWVDGAGETTAGTSECVSAFTVASGNKPRVTIPSLPSGVACANIYLTLADGASGTETLYATGVTTTTFDLLYAANSDPANVAPPTTNTTGLAKIQGLVDALFVGQSDRVMNRLSLLLHNFLSGKPMALNDVKKLQLQYSAALRAAAKAWDDVGALIVANPGTLGGANKGGAGQRVPVRTFS